MRRVPTVPKVQVPEVPKVRAAGAPKRNFEEAQPAALEYFECQAPSTLRTLGTLGTLCTLGTLGTLFCSS